MKDSLICLVWQRCGLLAWDVLEEVKPRVKASFSVAAGWLSVWFSVVWAVAARVILFSLSFLPSSSAAS